MNKVTSNPVPLLDLARQYASIRVEVDAAVRRVLESQRFILGPEGEGFERDCQAYFGVPAVVGVASGTDALYLAFRALDLRPGDEVLTTPFSFFATAGAIVNCGLRPVFSDIDPVSFNLDVPRAMAVRSPRTRAICVVHLFGQTADMALLCRSDGDGAPAVIEDACQSIGATWNGRRAGSIGDAAAFSFFPSKNLGCAGDGGLITSRQPDLGDRVRLLRHHGQDGPYEHRFVGINSRLDEIQAAILRVKLSRLEDWNEARRRNARGLADRFRASGLQVREGGAPDGADLSLPVEAPGARHVYNQFTIRARERDALREHLRAAGVGCAVYYPKPLHLQPALEFLGGRPGQFPQAEQASREAISLPVFPELTGGELDRIVSAVAGFYGPRA